MLRRDPSVQLDPIRSDQTRLVDRVESGQVGSYDQAFRRGGGSRKDETRTEIHHERVTHEELVDVGDDGSCRSRDGYMPVG